MDELVIREFIQEDCNEEMLTKELTKLLADGDYREQMLRKYERLKEVMGEIGASQRTAKLILKYLNFS